MSLIVQKFGGSSVRDAECVRKVAKRITNTYQQGHQVVVVVSAQGDTTDHLIAKAMEFNEHPSKREMDMLLSAGEQISSALLAIAIQKMGFPVVSLTGRQAGFVTNSCYSNARIHRIKTERLNKELDHNNIVIVAGFQGINKYDDITTLGRGGSDTSAVALSAALHADCCQIYTDVDGIYTADPRIVSGAVKLSSISFDEMLELATLGAQVLHNRSVEMAKKYHVKLEVLSSLEIVPGTQVKEENKVENMLIKGVAKDDDIARIALVGVPDVPGIAFKTFEILAKKKVNVDIILQSIGREDTKDISFTVPIAQKDMALEALADKKDFINAQSIEVDETVSKVSIVGSGMQSNPGVAAKMFEALYDADINIKMISTSEIKISVLLDRQQGKKAVQVIHDAFDFL